MVSGVSTPGPTRDWALVNLTCVLVMLFAISVESQNINDCKEYLRNADPRQIKLFFPEEKRRS